jgi:ribosomal protein S18 acetylase RimI-like enzyme
MKEIVRAELKHLEELGRLFNLYRIFYEEEDDIEKATNYITARFKNEDSIIFVSRRQDSTLNGFVQLYPSYCSVSTIPILILYDLFVDESERARGKGRLLMNAARDYAKENGYKRLELSTAKDNYIGQSLYESLGYTLDKEFLQYSLEIG